MDLGRMKVHRFRGMLLALRRRLWLRTVSRITIDAALYAALLLLLAGVVHYARISLPSGPLLLFAAALPLGACVWALLARRPGLVVAAAWADRQGGTKELFVSALELLGLPEAKRKTWGTVVLARADAASAEVALPAWGVGIGPGKGLAIAGFGACGAFLLSLPGQPPVSAPVALLARMAPPARVAAGPDYPAAPLAGLDMLLAEEADIPSSSASMGLQQAPLEGIAKADGARQRQTDQWPEAQAREDKRGNDTAGFRPAATGSPQASGGSVRSVAAGEGVDVSEVAPVAQGGSPRDEGVAAGSRTAAGDGAGGGIGSEAADSRTSPRPAAPRVRYHPLQRGDGAGSGGEGRFDAGLSRRAPRTPVDKGKGRARTAQGGWAVPLGEGLGQGHPVPNRDAVAAPPPVRYRGSERPYLSPLRRYYVDRYLSALGDAG